MNAKHSIVYFSHVDTIFSLVRIALACVIIVLIWFTEEKEKNVKESSFFTYHNHVSRLHIVLYTELEYRQYESDDCKMMLGIGTHLT